MATKPPTRTSSLYVTREAPATTTNHQRSTHRKWCEHLPHAHLQNYLRLRHRHQGILPPWVGWRSGGWRGSRRGQISWSRAATQDDFPTKWTAPKRVCRARSYWLVDVDWCWVKTGSILDYDDPIEPNSITCRHLLSFCAHPTRSCQRAFTVRVQDSSAPVQGKEWGVVNVWLWHIGTAFELLWSTQGL